MVLSVSVRLGRFLFVIFEGMDNGDGAFCIRIILELLEMGGGLGAGL